MEQTFLSTRAAQVEDGAAVADIYGPYVRYTAVSFEADVPTAAMMADRIEATLPTHPWLVVERDGAVVGFTYAGKHSQRAAYRWTVDVTVYVNRDECRGGVGRQLYGALLTTLRMQGFRSAFSEIVLPNPGSVRLHEAMGFRNLGVHKDIGHKLGQWHDIGYWRLGLSESSTPPEEPVPFASFRQTAAFSKALKSSRSAQTDLP